ncbi:MAG: ATPase [Candidatus Acidoferrum typicum]|nr:ATPase [Candidatus Acidoferrum typicum]
MPPTIFNFFGLRENPFKINPDPRFLFMTDQARATSDELAYAIRTRKGLILLTGEVGTGKTMLIRRLLDWLAEQKMPTALIFNSHIKPEHLLDFILNDFGVPCASNLKSEKLIALNRWLLERYRAGQIPVLIVDEAQGLEPAALEEIRLLLNFETPREKLLQIVLAGQPELEIKLKRHDLRQLRQRITIRCKTIPLTLEQTHGYIRERLRVAGANGSPIFEPEAVGCVHAYSRGIPRVINVLCEHSLVNACADGSTTISPSAVEQAAHDCQLDRVDSIARILNTGSYSQTSLSDIGSILASVSAGSDSATEPAHRDRSAAAAPPSSASQHVQPAPEPVRSPTVAEVLPGANAAQSEVPNAVARYVQEPAPQPQAVPVQIQRVAAQRPPAPTRSSLLDILRLWGTSFVGDARATSRQFRRAIRSFETKRWNPFIRNLQRELHQLRISTARLASDPRWKQLQTRAATTSQASWQRFKSAMPPWLAEPLGIHQLKTHNRAQSGASSRTNRRRTIMDLRRWLHQPLNSQRKRAHTNPRRS